MSSRGRSAAVFGGGVGAVAVAAAVARVACPGGCQTCEACLATAAPMGAGLLTLGGVLLGGRGLARRRRRPDDPDESSAVSGARAAQPAPEVPAFDGAHPDPLVERGGAGRVPRVHREVDTRHTATCEPLERVAEEERGHAATARLPLYSEEGDPAAVPEDGRGERAGKPVSPPREAPEVRVVAGTTREVLDPGVERLRLMAPMVFEGGVEHRMGRTQVGGRAKRAHGDPGLRRA